VALVDRTHGELSLSAQTQLLGLNRTSLYYQPVPPSEEEILLKHRIDKLYTDHPYYGSRRITEQLKREGLEVNRKAVMRHMHEMGLAAVYPGPNLSKRAHRQLFAHTCSPMSRQAILTTFGGWISRISVCGKAGSIWLPSWIGIRVMSTRRELDQTMQVAFVLEAMRRALALARPAICNSDQGSQFTSTQDLELLKEHEVRKSQDGRGRALDNIFTERLWRTIKYEEVYLKDYSSPREARQNLTEYLRFYNERRIHQALDYRTPAELYFQ
jgi:putative transposase